MAPSDSLGRSIAKGVAAGAVGMGLGGLLLRNLNRRRAERLTGEAKERYEKTRGKDPSLAAMVGIGAALGGGLTTGARIGGAAGTRAGSRLGARFGKWYKGAPGVDPGMLGGAAAGDILGSSVGAIGGLLAAGKASSMVMRGAKKMKEKNSSQLSPEQHAQAQQRAQQFLKAAHANPGLYRELMEKLGFSPWQSVKGIGSGVGARFPNMMSQALTAMGVGGALAAGSYGAQKGFEAVSAKLNKAKAYKEMVEARPDLKDRDPQAVQRAFNSLYKFNPQYARDPLVAGSFVDSVSTSERLDLGTVNSLVQARKNMAGPQLDPYKLVPKATAEDPEMHAARLQQMAEGTEAHKWKEEDRPMAQEQAELNRAKTYGEIHKSRSPARESESSGMDRHARSYVSGG